MYMRLEHKTKRSVRYLIEILHTRCLCARTLISYNGGYSLFCIPRRYMCPRIDTLRAQYSGRFYCVERNAKRVEIWRINICLGQHKRFACSKNRVLCHRHLYKHYIEVAFIKFYLIESSEVAYIYRLSIV